MSRRASARVPTPRSTNHPARYTCPRTLDSAGPLRRLVVSTIMSLDGYVMVPPTDGVVDAHHLDRQRAADTLLLGATTYRSLRAYWPTVADDPAVQETARRITEMRKVVVSDSLSEADTAPWTATTTIVRRTDAREAVAALKGRPGADILMVGSRALWPDLLVAGLVDELYVTVGAAVLGGGTPAFGTGPIPRLHLLEVTRREGSSTVLLRYAVDGTVRS